MNARREIDATSLTRANSNNAGTGPFGPAGIGIGGENYECKCGN